MARTTPILIGEKTFKISTDFLSLKQTNSASYECNDYVRNTQAVVVQQQYFVPFSKECKNTECNNSKIIYTHIYITTITVIIILIIVLIILNINIKLNVYV